MCTCMLSYSVVSDSATPWTVALQAPLSMGFSRQEYWSGLPCPLPGDLPDPEGWNRHLLCLLHWQADSLPLSRLGGLMSLCKYKKSSCGRKCQNTAVRVAWCPCKRHVQVLIRGDSTSSCLETGSLQIKLSWGSWDEIVVDLGLTLNPTPMSPYKRERAVWDPEWEMVEKAMWDRSRDGSDALGSWGALWIPASHQHLGDRIA